jgi:uroporphyrinogen-III synthase
MKNPGPALPRRDELPLLDRRLLLTTPRNYASPLAALLITRGARPVWLPANEIWALDDSTLLDEALRGLAGYDWVVFTSENGIDVFCQRLATLGLDREQFARTRLAAFRWDAARLEKAGFKVDLVPPESSTIGLVEEFRRRGISRGHVLAPVPRVEGAPEPPVIPDFIRGLNNLGLEAVRVPAYRTVAKVERAEAELGMLRAGEIDCVVFTSSTEIYAFLAWLGEERTLLDQIPCAYLGLIILDTARRKRLRLDITQKGVYTFLSLVDAIEEYFRHSLTVDSVNPPKL